MNKFYAILIPVFFMMSCTIVKPLEFNDVQNVEIQNVSFTSVNMTVTMEIYNPNRFKVELQEADLDIYVEGQHMGKVATESSMVFPKKESKSYTIPLQTSLGGILSGGLSFLKSLTTNEVKLQVKGTITAKALSIRKKIDIDFDDSVSLIR